MIPLIPNAINNVSVWIQIPDARSYNPASPTLVNAVDAVTGVLVFSWLLVIEAMP
jgi:hypothetical protein